jgi:predicted esterase YcpF (UPF0227 family)
MEIPYYEGDINENMPMPHGFQGRRLDGESPDYVVHSTGSDSLVISFSGVGKTPDGEAIYSFGHLPERYGVNLIQLRDYYQVWFLNGVRGVSTNVRTTLAALHRIIDDLSPQRLITVGASAGGYSAILYGVLLGADSVIAINPQTLLKPGIECIAHGNLYMLKWCDPSETVYHDLLNLNMTKSRTKIEILYGHDDRVDRFHSGRMAAKKNVVLQSVSGDHGTSAISMRDAGLLAKVLNDHLSA